MHQNEDGFESPAYVRMSLAAAMTLGFKPGLFYRNAKLHCINLLLTYDNGCSARCAYCGLSKERPGIYSRKSFIRVPWPTYGLEKVIERIADRQETIKRICISMITNRHSVQDTNNIIAILRTYLDTPISVLVSPTIVVPETLIEYKKAGADKIGVAIDLATPELFQKLRGAGVGGPHRWDTYWQCLGNASQLFGKGNAGAHFIVGMGETERDMCRAIQRVRDLGGKTHLFSFFPEGQSLMARYPQPPMAQYRRIQIARYLIDRGAVRAEEFQYGENEKIIGFGLCATRMNDVVNTGEPFLTSGCEGLDGNVACNRPYANSRPGPGIRNYPFPPNEKDMMRIRTQVKLW